MTNVSTRDRIQSVYSSRTDGREVSERENRAVGSSGNALRSMIVERDVRVAMRDGVELSVDVFRPSSQTPVPVLVAMSPYGKDVQSLPVPPQVPTSPVYSRQIEAGSPEYFVDHGYVHLIADVRGIGASGDVYRGWMSRDEGDDGYDLVEWAAAQPWSDGNVGMVGVSYFGTIQLHVAATRPPHLKAIMPWNAPADFYRESTHHGGILHSFYLYLYTTPIRGRASSELVETLSEVDLADLKSRLAVDADLRMYPDLYNLVRNPDRVPNLFDVIAHEFDGRYYWERSAYTKYHEIDIPAYCASGWWAYAHMHLRGAFQNYQGLDVPKKLYIESRVEAPAPMDDEYNAEVVRWYDHWLKGIATGIMEEPPIRLHVRNVGDRFEQEWPLARTAWTPYFLRRFGELDVEPERVVGRPDVFVQQPVEETSVVATLEYSTAPLPVDTEVIGPIALTFFADIDQEDTNWLVAVSDVAPDGDVVELSRGFLKASHRAVDEARSMPWEPFHPHLTRDPVVPGEVVEYKIGLAPIANLFLRGHRIRLTFAAMDHQFWPPPNAELGLGHTPWHVCSSKTVMHRIYHDDANPSRLVIPVVPSAEST